MLHAGRLNQTWRSGRGTRIVWTTGDEALDNFPSWAPDGRLTVVSDRDGGFEVYTVNLPDSSVE
jgi:Tol biopolymer transport system component